MKKKIMFNKYFQILAAMWTRLSWFVMLPISAAAFTRMVMCAATITVLMSTVMWVRVAQSIVAGSGAPLSVGLKSIFYEVKDIEEPYMATNSAERIA